MRRKPVKLPLENLNGKSIEELKLLHLQLCVDGFKAIPGSTYQQRIKDAMRQVSEALSEFRLVAAFGKYDYYRQYADDKYVYNIVPKGSPAPAGGYYDPEYICAIKKVPNLFNNPHL